MRILRVIPLLLVLLAKTNMEQNRSDFTCISQFCQNAASICSQVVEEAKVKEESAAAIVEEPAQELQKASRKPESEEKKDGKSENDSDQDGSSDVKKENESKKDPNKKDGQQNQDSSKDKNVEKEENSEPTSSGSAKSNPANNENPDTQKEKDQSEKPEDVQDCVMEVVPNHGRVLWVGDSRTVQLRNALKRRPDLTYQYEDLFFCKGAEGYNYFTSTAIPAVNEVLTDSDVIVMNFGINDMYQINNYIQTMNDLVSESGAWHNNRVIYMAVNPVDDARSKVKNADIEAFNQMLQDFLDPSIYFMDTYTTLQFYKPMQEEFDEEGVHYSAPKSNTYMTYCYLYGLIRNVCFETGRCIAPI